MIMQFCMQSFLIFTEVRKHTGAVSLSGHFLYLGVYWNNLLLKSYWNVWVGRGVASFLTSCRLQCSLEAASKPFSTTKYRGIWRRLYKVKLFFQAMVNSYSLSNTETLYRYSWGNWSHKQLLLTKQQSQRLKWQSHHHSYFFDKGSWVMTANKSARKWGA